MQIDDQFSHTTMESSVHMGTGAGTALDSILRLCTYIELRPPDVPSILFPLVFPVC